MKKRWKIAGLALLALGLAFTFSRSFIPERRHKHEAQTLSKVAPEVIPPKNADRLSDRNTGGLYHLSGCKPQHGIPATQAILFSAAFKFICPAPS